MTDPELAALLGIVFIVAMLAGPSVRRMFARKERSAAYEPKRSLPLFADSRAAQRVRAVARRCAQCRYWHWQRGQEAIKANPAFFQATQWLSPEQMSRAGTGYEDGLDAGEPDPSSNVENAPPDVPLPRYGRPIDWSEFGACTHPRGPHDEGPENTHSDYSCGRWT